MNKLSPITAIQNAASEAVRVIAQAATDSTIKLANAAEAAAKVVTTAAAEQVKVVDVKNAGDHDLLVVLNTKMEDIKISVRELSLKDGLYVLKDDFTFWRNLLVSGLLLSIFIGVVLNLINK